MQFGFHFGGLILIKRFLLVGVIYLLKNIINSSPTASVV
jgi:hypothetical protein